MPNLKTIGIDNCPKLTDVSALQIFKTKFDGIGIDDSNNIDITGFEGIKVKCFTIMELTNVNYWELYTTVKATEVYFRTEEIGAPDNWAIVSLYKNYVGHNGFVVQTDSGKEIYSASGNKIPSYNEKTYTPKELVAAYPEMRQAVINAGFDV